MIAKDAATKIRQRLRDTDARAFSDETILLEIALVQNDLIRDFRKNIKFKRALIDSSRNFITLPAYALKIHNTKFNNKEIFVADMPTAMRSKKAVLATENLQIFYIFPKDSNGVLEMFYSEAVAVDSLESRLVLEDIFINALVYGVLARLFEIELSETNLARVGNYQQLYEMEKNKLRALFGNIAQNYIKTPFVKV